MLETENRPDTDSHTREAGIIYASTIHARELVPGFFDRTRLPRELGSGNFEIKIFEDETSFKFDVKLPSLKPGSLLRLLKKASYSDQFERTYAVMNDWDICFEETRSGSDEKRRLFEGHSKMDAFKEFSEVHAVAFWNSLTQVSEKKTRKAISRIPRIVTSQWWLNNNELTEEVANKPYRRGFFETAGRSAYVWINNIIDSKTGVAKRFPETKEKLKSAIASSGIFNSPPPYKEAEISREEMAEIFKNFYSSLTEEERIAFEEKNTDEFVVYRDSDEDGKIYRQSTLDSNIASPLVGKEGKNRIAVCLAGSYQIFELGEGDNLSNIPVKATEKLIAPSIQLAPNVLWSADKETGERKYDCGILATETEILDGLLGKIFVIASSRETKTQFLPKSLSIEPFGKLMGIGAAQIPVACSYYDQEFLNGSQFIKRVENLKP